MSALQQKPDILAPAGGRAQLEAAVHAGADAVYFGLQDSFNARARATGFTLDQLEDTMAYLHAHGCRGYLTLNTLVFDEELSKVEAHIRHAAHCGVDALIIQDIGVARLAHAIAPHLPLHASTQMSITDAQGVALAAQLGMRRVVLGRELSIEEIAKVRAASELEIEVFVHGALCVSYSGQCFSSEAWGGRSANRGQCAQTCRLPYGLLVDGKLHTQGDEHYLLSPQDLMALPLVPQLIEAGVNCFKIEGRLKGPEYVLSTVSAYRAAVDKAWAAHQHGEPTAELTIPRQTRQRLAQVFSRGQDAQHDGLTPGFLRGPQHQELVIGRSPRHRGLYLGQVLELTERGVTLQLHNPLKAGDGVVFDNGTVQRKEPGGNVFHLLRDGERVRDEIEQGLVELSFGQHFNPRGIAVGDRVWRTKDASMDAPTTLDRHNAADRMAVTLSLQLHIGEVAKLTLADARGHQVKVNGQREVETASGRPLDEAAVSKAIGQLGDTPFCLSALHCELDAGSFLPLGEIKNLRRQAVHALQDALQQHQRDQDLASEPVLARLLPPREPLQSVAEPQLSLLCRTREQVEAALALAAPQVLILDFLEVHGLKQACEAVRSAGRTLVVAAPRIFKPGEERLVRYLCHLQPDALLVRSPGLLLTLNALGGTGASFDDQVKIPALWGDFSLNAANVLSAQKLLALGLSRLTPTHDLNAEQIAALSEALPAEQRAKLEVIAHQHLPIFHTEHCVFARFMSHGNSYKDCGRPCEQHQVHLRDPGGADHLLQADVGCRNTVFNAQAQSGAPFINHLRKAGIAHYRIELVDEPGDEVAGIVQGYQALFEQKIDAQTLWRQLGQVRDANAHAQGVNAGSLSVRLEQLQSEMKKPSAR